MKSTYEKIIQNSNRPIIAVISPDEFKEAVYRASQLSLDKMILFLKSIPGFQSLSKTSAKKILSKFIMQRVNKGWKVDSNKNDKVYLI